MVRSRSPVVVMSATVERRYEIGVLPRFATSRGLTPAASSPSVAQPVITGLDATPSAKPKPPSAFCAPRSQLTASARPPAAAAGESFTAAGTITAHAISIATPVTAAPCWALGRPQANSNRLR